MKQFFGVALLTGASTLALAWTANAQAQTNAANELEEVVVTGSRVITNGNNSPTPVTVVTLEDLQTTHPSRVFESLLDIPAFAGSRGGVASNPSGNRATSAQISALNLRGIGPVRTLLLYDGHRVPPTQLDGVVNANTIPQMLLERVDIVTGGASAVYGSDAVGGVVNFVTNRNFNGVKFELQGGISERSDAESYQAGVAFGTELFGGRGHFQGSLQTLHDDGILVRNDRKQFRGAWTVQGNGTTIPYYLVADARNSGASFGGKITGPATNPLINTTFNSNGVLTSFANGSAAGLPAGSATRIGGDGFYDTSATLKPRQTINQLYGRFDFDLTDDLHYFVSVAGTRDHAFNNFGNVASTGLILSATNAFLPLAYQQQMQTAGVTTFTLSKKYGLESRVPPSNVEFYSSSLYVNTGLEGSLGDYKWEASYTYSDVELDARSNYTFNNGRHFSALDAVPNPANPGGAPVCWVSTQPQFASLYPGCVPINPFGPSSETQAAVDYVRQKGKAVTKLPSHDIAAFITGAPFENWIGPVNMALSGEWRRQGLEVTSDKPTVDFAVLDCAGIRFNNCRTASATVAASPAYNGGVAPRTPVHTTVIEGALEADVPLIEALPLVQSANLNLAYRYAKYTSTGNPDLSAPEIKASFIANTWKVGLDWHFNDVLSLRATRSRDIRAPNLNDLFQTNGTTYTQNTLDRLTNRSLTGTGAQVQLVAGGTPTLQPEVAATTTMGLVFKPTADFSMAVDVFSIKITDFITSLNGGNPLIQQGCYAGNAYLCSLQVRPGPLTDTSPANAVTRYYIVPANASELSTEGVDVELNYKTEIASRPFSVRALLTYQPHVYFLQPGATRQDFAGALGTPVDYATGAQKRATVFAAYQPTDKLTIAWQTNWRSRMHQSPDPALLEQRNAGAPSVTFSNMTLSYSLDVLQASEATVYLNVQNVFDRQAPIAASLVDQSSPGIAGGYVPGDDPTGRYYRLGARFRW